MQKVLLESLDLFMYRPLKCLETLDTQYTFPAECSNVDSTKMLARMRRERLCLVVVGPTQA